MRKVLTLAALLLSFALAVAAQEIPQAEVFGGYSYMRVNPGQGAPAINSNGWNASAVGNINRWLGVKADFTGQYGNIVGVGGSMYNFMFGPQISIPTGNFKPFVEGLVGGSHAGGSGISDTGLGYAFGGGLDYNVKPHVSVRLAELDYVGTQLFGGTQHNFRLSTGVVFRLGSK